jgi:surface polysaccharide O-acyltransferase-like enzyme
MNLISSKRYNYLDLIKVIAIYLVCFYHVANLNYNIVENSSSFIYFNYFIKTILSPCVPLFFMVNGALLLNKEYDLKKHIKKTVRLFILTFIWGIILLSVYGVIMKDSYTIITFIKSLITWKEGRLNLLWFLQTLTCIYILFPIIKFLYDNNKKILNYLLIIIAIFTFGIVILDMILNIIQIILSGHIVYDGLLNTICDKFNPFKGFYSYSIVYFILGGILFEKIKNNDIKITNVKLLLISSVSCLILFGYGILISKNMNNLCDIAWYGYNTIMTLLTSTSIFIFCSKLENNIKHTKFLTIISSNTLGIYLLHCMINRIISPYYISISISSNFIINIIYTFVILLISLVIVFILKKIPIIKELFKLG